MRDATKNPRRSAVVKATQVLGSFEGPYRTRGVTEISNQLGIPKPTVHRLLNELAEAGLVEKLPRGRYQIGMRMFELGSLAHQASTLRSLALSHLHNLSRKTTYTVYLSVVDKQYSVQLERIPAVNRPEVRARWGARWSLHCSSGGKALLAFGAASVDLDEELKRPLTRFSIRDKAQLLEELEQIRECGYALSRQESIVGVYGVAAPIFDARGRVVAAVGIAGHDHSLLGLTDVVVQSARDISETLRLNNWVEIRRNS